LSRTLTWKGGFWPALPIRLARAWIPVAALLIVFNLFMIVIGFTHPALIGYGGGTEQPIALSVIAVGLVSFFFTRYVQLGVHGKRLLRDTPASPAPVAARSDS
jgi:hypothetical protein